MLFNSYSFIFLFLPVVLLGYFALGRPSHLAPVVWLTLASLVFYAFGGWQFVPLLLASIAFNYGVGDLLIVRKLGPGARFAVLTTGVAGDLLVLGIFKYAGFFAANLNTLFSTGLVVNIVLPVGISFYTFTQIAFLVDAYRGNVARYALPHYALFVTYFPHLIAGPILHHKDMIPQFERAETRRPRSASDPVRPDHLRHRTVQEDVPGRRHSAAGVAGVRSHYADLRSGMDRRAGLHVPALFRFLRLFRHGDRHVADVRHLPAAEFQFAL
jgi:D-alanyl-lipoteichoic acid acyltransferase DltB (MBOAT superfamily)